MSGREARDACTEPGEDVRSDGKYGGVSAGAGQVICGRRPRLSMEGGIVEDVQGVAAEAARKTCLTRRHREAR
jgi:hypothetical protein